MMYSLQMSDDETRMLNVFLHINDLDHKVYTDSRTILGFFSVSM